MPISPDGDKIKDAEATVKVEESEMNEDGSFKHTESPADDAKKDSSPEKSLHEVISDQLKPSREKLIDSPDSEKEVKDEDKEPESSDGDPGKGKDDQPKEVDEVKKDEPEKTLEDKPEDAQTTQDEEDVTKIPSNLKAETKVRFEKLVESNQDLKSQVDELEEYKQNSQDIFAATGSTSEQMAETFELLRLSNSNNREDNLDAMKALGRITKSLARRIGEKIPGDDLLEDHPDLKEKVEKLEMTLLDAEDSAVTRNKLKAIEDEKELQKKATDKQGETDEETQKAQTQIVNMATNWQNNDPNWKAVSPEVLGYAQSIKGKYPVAMIPQLLQDFYERIVAQRKSVKKTIKAVKEDMPLSPSSAGPGTKEPKTHREAVAGPLAKSRITS